MRSDPEESQVHPSKGLGFAQRLHRGLWVGYKSMRKVKRRGNIQVQKGRHIRPNMTQLLNMACHIGFAALRSLM
jgi:hypothetical protein